VHGDPADDPVVADGLAGFAGAGAGAGGGDRPDLAGLGIVVFARRAWPSRWADR
jgi:hypothetical protein